MPAFVTHYFFAADIYNNLNKDIKNVIEDNRAFYDIGAQGPDIFFFNKPYKNNEVIRYGNELHNKNADIIINQACINIKNNNDNKALAYLLGYVSHFILDSAFHPIINKACQSFNEHMILETELDRTTLSSRNLETYQFKRYRLINKDINYGEHLSLVFDKVSASEIQQSIIQTRKYMKLLYSPWNIKGSVIEMLCTIFTRKSIFSNMIITKKINTDYDSIISDLLHSYDELVELGCKLYQNIIYVYNGQAKLDNRFKRNYE